MGFSRKLLLLILRVLLLFIFIGCFFYAIYETEYVVSPAMFLALALISLTELVFYLRKQEKNWAQFLLSIEHHDFNRGYLNKTSSKRLLEAYELITSSFEKIQTDKQAEHRLLQTVLKHIPIGLMCYSEDGNVVFINDYAKAILEVEALVKIDRLQEKMPSLFSLLKSENIFSSELIEGNGDNRLLVKTEKFSLQGESYRLVSLADIRSTLEENEIESYQKLMSVMTHEIMNSATPILSLIRVVNDKLIDGEEFYPLDKKAQKNVATSLEAIETRTSGMLKFVEAYRKINRSIQPHFEKIDSSQFIDQVLTLLKPSIDINCVDSFKKPLNIDIALMSQVLINILKNALEASSSEPNPVIGINIKELNGQVVITIFDNGPGIPITSEHKIFIPFFTTKEEGSGVGLAISRKIIKAHNGILSYERENERTNFTITIPIV